MLTIFDHRQFDTYADVVNELLLAGFVQRTDGDFEKNGFRARPMSRIVEGGIVVWRILVWRLEYPSVFYQRSPLEPDRLPD